MRLLGRIVQTNVSKTLHEVPSKAERKYVNDKRHATCKEEPRDVGSRPGERLVNNKIWPASKEIGDTQDDGSRDDNSDRPRIERALIGANYDCNRQHQYREHRGGLTLRITCAPRRARALPAAVRCSAQPGGSKARDRLARQVHA